VLLFNQVVDFTKQAYVLGHEATVSSLVSNLIFRELASQMQDISF
jgi:hypothetical protein